MLCPHAILDHCEGLCSHLHLLSSFYRFVTSLVYYGVSLNVGNFGLDIYLTQLIFGIAEVPARLGCFPLIEKFGRRICQSVALFIGGAACLIILAIPEGIFPKSK